MKRGIAATTFFVAFACGAVALADEYVGPGFSGEAYIAEGGENPRRLGTVHVDRPGFRMSIESDGQQVGSLILWGSDTAYSLLLDHQLYMQVPAADAGLNDYQARPCVGYTNSRKLGLDSVDGRAAEKWRCSGKLNTPPGQSAGDATVWYDREIAFEIRAMTDDGRLFEIRRVVIGRQDRSLFEVPQGFRRLDPELLMPAQ